jgi:hypothetical protein
MTRYLVRVYKIEIPENGSRRDDIDEATEDWLGKLGADKCFMFQMQGPTLGRIAARLSQHEANTTKNVTGVTRHPGGPTKSPENRGGTENAC